MQSVFIFLMLISFSCFSAQKCVNGVSTIWLQNQKTKAIELKRSTPLKICNYIIKQEGANLKLRFLKNTKLVYETRIFWSKITHHDIIKKNNKIISHITKQMDYKILKLPLMHSQVNRYEAIDIETGMLLGEGAFK